MCDVSLLALQPGCESFMALERNLCKRSLSAFLNACPSLFSALTGGLVFSFSFLGSCIFFLCVTAGPGQFACWTDDKRHSACQSRWRSVTVHTRRCLLVLWPRDLAACLLSQRRGRWGRNKFDTDTIIPQHHPSPSLFLFQSSLKQPSRIFWREITMQEGSLSWRPSTSVETNWTTRSHWQIARLCSFWLGSDVRKRLVTDKRSAFGWTRRSSDG